MIGTAETPDRTKSFVTSRPAQVMRREFAVRKNVWTVWRRETTFSIEST